MKLEEHIANHIRDEFDEKHLSGNLRKTIEVSENKVRIPAKVYDINRWIKEKVIVYNGVGSYASHLDIVGSDFYIGKYHIHPHNHIGYVEDSILNAVQEWARENSYQIEVRING